MMNVTEKPADTLLSRLDHIPRPLQFGTSGRRGLLIELTQLEAYINALAELEYLQTLSPEEGGIVRGDEFFFASDLRPSSTCLVPGTPLRGELAQAIAAAITAGGMKPVYCGAIPTPALTAYALAQGKGSMMVTGSHIPFDRNGYKTNTSRGELLKQHEPPINEVVQKVRERVYAMSFPESEFDVNGQFKSGHRELPAVHDAARQAYLQRYSEFFGPTALTGLRVLVYQHSAVGRDILPDILRSAGAEVIEVGRSEVFVPIDTENIEAGQLASMQSLLDLATVQHGPIDALVSTDGDSDRPLILGVDSDSGQARFFGGDLVGMITAGFIGADAMVVPVSCNDAIDRGPLKDRIEPKTRIGSPFVIAGMEKARRKGSRAVCGWEANGGFLTGSEINRHGRKLAALPTRDAVLPILAVLAASREQGLALTGLFEQLPARFSRAALLKAFPRDRSLAITRRFTPDNPDILEVEFDGSRINAQKADGTELILTEIESSDLQRIRAELERYFLPSSGFSAIHRMNVLDGIRIYFDNGDVAHLRPSGNADELRIYAVADRQDRANEITAAAVAEPDGILRTMERTICQSS